MDKRFWLILGLLLFFNLFLHFFAIKDNNLFFTVDQGRDAVYVREILESKRLFLRGPETSVRGVFSGPLWYYFIAWGYFLSGGHPVGGIWVLVFLNSLTLLVLAVILGKKASPTLGIITVLGLTFFWPFFTTSLWQFNPFPAAALVIFLILFLIKFLEGQKKYFLFAGVIILLTFNTNLASAAALTVFYLLVGLIGIYKRKVLEKFSFLQKFIFLTLTLLIISFLFFGINWQHYRSWQTAYLPPLIFIATVFIIWQMKKLRFFWLSALLLSSFWHLQIKFQDYLTPSPNTSILYNQLATIDWIYENAADQGFKVYNYTNTFYDYPYQYLFYWYGLKHWDYLPDEYANYPLSPKELYVPAASKYSQPKRSGEKTAFLIIQSDTNGEDNKDWINKFREHFNLTKETKIGNIRIEKYERKHDSPNDPCIWWGDCLF